MQGATTTFWKAFIKHPRQTGAIVPSSQRLAQAMLARTCLQSAQLVIELGPGTGAFTASILNALPPDATFLAIERNPELVEFLRRQWPQAQVICDNAAHLSDYLARYPHPPAAIFCGLPLSWLPAQERTDVLDAVATVLPSGATFTLFQYIHAAATPPGRRVRQELMARFQSVEHHPIWWNLPPAYVVHCVR